jgi:hypothetical protein
MVKLTKTIIFTLSLSLCSCGGTPGKLASLAEKAKSYVGYEDNDGGCNLNCVKACS